MNLIEIGENIKKMNSKLDSYTYICPDDRKYIEIGNMIKYTNIYNTNKLKTGIVLEISSNKIKLKSMNSNLIWTIKFTENHIYYKFKNDDIIDALNDLFEKNEKNI
jgi:hypothetical protein